MKEDVENAVVEFTNYAAKIYSWGFNQFRNSIRNINRRKEENVFKMQLAKYASELKKQLAQHVKLVADSHPEMHKQIESVLSEKIDYYLQAFWQKCSAL
jgi:hypothetical protein